jgi:hypothetical protein
MIDFDPDWIVSVHKSLAVYFNTNKGDTELFVEGYERDTESLHDYLELRVDGPYIKEYTKDCWRLYFEVNVLITVQQSGNVYRIDELIARVCELLIDAISVSTFDSNGDVDGHLGCLQIHKERNYKTQVSVEGHYSLFMD